MLGGKCFNICLLLRPLQVRKLPFLISFTKFLGVELKQHPYRYCTRYVLVFFRVIIAWVRCLNGIEMGMSHNLSVMFLYPLKIILDSLRILISFLSKMAMQSLSQIYPKEISKVLCSPSKMCAIFALILRTPDNGMSPVFVSFIVALLGNFTVGPLWVYFMSFRNS